VGWLATTAAAGTAGYAAGVPARVEVCALAVSVVGALWWRHRPSARFRRQLGGAAGWLDRHDLAKRAGKRAIRAQAATRRAARRARRKPDDYGLSPGRLVSGSWWVRYRRVYWMLARGVLVVGPQGSGKSSWLVERVVKLPGAAYVTSTKTELVDMTARLRARRGPVSVFNPTGLGGLESSFRWDPLSGCEDQAVADARARALVRGGGGADGAKNADFWADKAAEIIRCYLMAARIGGLAMSSVMHWALNPDEPTPVSILEEHSALVPSGWLQTLRANLKAVPETRTGYFAAVAPAVSFLDNPRVAAACRPGAGTSFDVTEFLAKSGTLYVIAGEDRRIAPLLTALTESVFGQAKQVAATQPFGRLDPGLAFVLDEIANMTPVPLDVWAADSRGWNITVLAVVQDLAQLETRWGRAKAKTIFSNLPTRVVLPGVAIKDDLETFAYLGGQRPVEDVTENRTKGGQTHSHSRKMVFRPVITGHMIYGMPQWHAYVLGLADRHPAIVRYRPGHRYARAALGRLHRRELAGRIVAWLRARPLRSSVEPALPGLASLASEGIRELV
jgi:hypothetical protein